MHTREQITEKAKEILDSNPSTRGLGLCLDLIEEAQRAETLEEGAQIIVDDSLYWAGFFHGVPGI